MIIDLIQPQIGPILSNSSLFDSVRELGHSGVRVFTHKPHASPGFGLATTHIYDKWILAGSIFQFYRIDQGCILCSILCSNIRYMMIYPQADSFEDDCRYYEHFGQGRWSRIPTEDFLPWTR